MFCHVHVLNLEDAAHARPPCGSRVDGVAAIEGLRIEQGLAAVSVRGFRREQRCGGQLGAPFRVDGAHELVQLHELELLRPAAAQALVEQLRGDCRLQR